MAHKVQVNVKYRPAEVNALRSNRNKAHIAGFTSAAVGSVGRAHSMHSPTSPYNHITSGIGALGAYQKRDALHDSKRITNTAVERGIKAHPAYKKAGKSARIHTTMFGNKRIRYVDKKTQKRQDIKVKLRGHNSF